MRSVDRSQVTAPGALGAVVNGRSELEWARDHYRQPYDPKTGNYNFAVYKHDEVKAKLDELFHGKCAYCETPYAATAPVDVEHYRPKGAVEGESDHLGYWWLAMVWANLLPSCIDCNRRRRQVTPEPDGSLVRLDNAARRFSSSRVMLSGKKDAFPVAGARALDETSLLESEDPLLLNPCEDNPTDHLVFLAEPSDQIGLVLPKPLTAGTPAALPVALPSPAEVAADAARTRVSARGAVSIQVYGLNRLGLVQERTRILRRLDFLEQMAIEIGEIAESLTDIAAPQAERAVRRLNLLQDQMIREMRRMAEPQEPYSAMVEAWIQGFIQRLG